MTPERSDPLSLDEVRVGAAYDTERADSRRRVAELKRFRRVHLGDALALVFENRDTIRSTLEEALRTEHVEDPAQVEDEIAAFSAVVPEPGDLAATLFLEVDDPADLNATLLRLDGAEDSVFIEVAGKRVRGVPEEVFPRGESVLAHYLRFSLEPDQREAILRGSPIAVGTDHPACATTVQLDEEHRQAIARDL